MNESTITEANTIAELPAGHSAYVAGSALAWQPKGERMQVKTLFASPDGRNRTLLFRLEPGAQSAPHAHEELEQIYVLEGSFNDGDKLLRTGDHCVRAAGVMHTAQSSEGALVLVVYSPA